MPVRRSVYQRRLLRSTGRVKASRPLPVLLYLLMRDQVPFGVLHDLVEQSLAEIDLDPLYTNGHLGRYAEHLARRLERRKAGG